MVLRTASRKVIYISKLAESGYDYRYETRVRGPREDTLHVSRDNDVLYHVRDHVLVLFVNKEGTLLIERS